MHALAEMELGDAPPSCFSSHIGDIPFFRVYLVLYFFFLNADFGDAAISNGPQEKC